jgi:hypothetical protein
MLIIWFIILVVIVFFVLYKLFGSLNGAKLNGATLVEGMNNKQKIKLLSAVETKDFLLSDSDGYIARLTQADLVARELSGSYMDFLSSATYIDCPEDMVTIIADANALIAQFADVEDGWVNKSKLQALPWIIGISPNGYEFNLPHTRGQVIMLPGLVDAGTLVHEKLHVYQKMFPKDFEKYLHKQGFTLSKKSVKRAANPDADIQVYERDGVPWYGRYINEGADVQFTPVDSPRYDCPREYAVYTLVERYTKNKGE